MRSTTVGQIRSLTVAARQTDPLAFMPFELTDAFPLIVWTDSRGLEGISVDVAGKFTDSDLFLSNETQNLRAAGLSAGTTAYRLVEYRWKTKMVDGCVKALLALFGWLLRLVLNAPGVSHAPGVWQLAAVCRRFESSVTSGASALNPEFLACLRIPALRAAPTETVSAVQSTSRFPDPPGHRRAPSLQRAHGVATRATSLR